MMAVVQKINSISQKESIALSYLRIIATLLIVICHFLEAFDNRWAYVCNIGVQIFLVMSGYLYGRKEITHWKDWFIKRIEKVYLPMFILITIVFILYFFLCRNELSVLSCLMYYFDLQGFAFAGGGEFTITGIRHLWFVTAIFLCYFVTPILQKTENKANLLLPLCLAGLIVSYLLIHIRIAFVLSWVFVYSIGYYYARLIDKTRIIIEIIMTCIVVYLLAFTSWNEYLTYFNIKNRIVHDIGGCLFFILLLRVLQHITNLKISKCLQLLDKYSYEIYLTHFVLLFGPLSVLYITVLPTVNIIITLLLIVITVCIFTYIEKQVNVLIKKVFKYEN